MALGGSDAGSHLPIPDPTALTTEQLRRELAGLRELLEARLAAMETATTLRLSQTEQIPGDITTAVTHLRDLHDRDMTRISETLVERNLRYEQAFEERDSRFLQAKELTEATVEAAATAVAQLREVHEEKFRGIAGQFIERDVRTTQASGAADDALKAALQAAKELVGAQGEASAAAAVKSETSFTKQIDQIGTIIQTLEKALDARITELKERIDRGEGANQGAQVLVADQRGEAQGRHGTQANYIAAVGIAIAVMALITTLIVAFAIKP